MNFEKNGDKSVTLYLLLLSSLIGIFLTMGIAIVGVLRCIGVVDGKNDIMLFFIFLTCFVGAICSISSVYYREGGN